MPPSSDSPAPEAMRCQPSPPAPLEHDGGASSPAAVASLRRLARAVATEVAAADGAGGARGAAAVARAAQRLRPQRPCETTPLAAATCHAARARALLALADEYTHAVWDSHPRPRRFFAQHRGVSAVSGDGGRASLPAFRLLYLTAALAAADRAAELMPTASSGGSLECACLAACAAWELRQACGCGGAHCSQLAARVAALCARHAACNCAGGGDATAATMLAAEQAALYGDSAGEWPGLTQRLETMTALRDAAEVALGQLQQSAAAGEGGG